MDVTDHAICCALASAIKRRVPRGTACRAADFLGISKAYMSFILNGRVKPLGLMLRIAQDLGASVEVTIDGQRVRSE